MTMEQAGSEQGENPSLHERVHSLAIQLINEGRANGRPTYEAARIICREEDEKRREALEQFRSGELSELDRGLFPESIFESDGCRKKYEDGRPRQTEAEMIMYAEYADGQGM